MNFELLFSFVAIAFVVISVVTMLMSLWPISFWALISALIWKLWAISEQLKKSL